MIEFGVSSWSVHGLLGKVRYAEVSDTVVLKSGDPEGALSLLELPKIVKEQGLTRLEICHFHFPRTDDAYLASLRGSLQENGIQLDTVLIDDGNLSQEEDGGWSADIAMAKRWIEITGKVGGKAVRADCGKEPAGPQSRQRATEALRILADHGAKYDVKVVTENFHPTSVEADDLLTIMAGTKREIGLCVDFGNADNAKDKFGTLARLMPYGTSIHGKASYVENEIEHIDFDRCLGLMNEAGFSGPFVLIVGETEGEWDKIHQLRQYVVDRLTPSTQAA